MPVTAAETYFKQVADLPFLTPTGDRDKARIREGATSKVKWLGGESETGPWIYYIENPAGSVVKPHKHFAPRVEFIIEGKIKFYEGTNALAHLRGDSSAVGTVHATGSLSYVPSGVLYSYDILESAKMLHVFYENPVTATVHVDAEGKDLPSA